MQLTQLGVNLSSFISRGKFVLGVIGDSNANGASTAITTASANTLYNFNGTTFDMITNESVSNGNPTLGSIWHSFANEYRSVYRNPVYLINGGKGGTYFSNDVAANSWGSSGDLRGLFATKVANGLAAINRSALDMIIVNMGINDARNAYATATVTTAINDLFDYLDTTYPGVTVLVVQQGRSEVSLLSNLFYNVRNSLVNKIATMTNVHMCGQGYPLVFSGGYEADNLHYNATGQLALAKQFVRWLNNAGYSKWGRSVISSLFSDPTPARKTLIDTFISGQVTAGNFLKLDSCLIFKTDNASNVLVDFSFMGYGAVSGATIALNDCAQFDGVDDYIATAIIPSLSTRTSATSVISGVKVKTNTSSGVVALFGASDDSPASSLSLVNNGVRYRVNDGTLSAGTDTLFQANTFYAIRRNGTTKQLMKNKVSNASTVQANTGVNNGFAMLVGAVQSNTGIASFWNGEAHYFMHSGFTSFDYDNFYDGIEALIAAW